MIHGVPQNISRCECAERPRCQMYGGSCESYADGFAIVLASWSPPWRFTSKFTCAACWEFFYKAWTTPIPGWDRPEWADAEWKPSIDTVIDMARLKLNEEARREHEKRGFESEGEVESQIILQKGAEYSPEQMKQLMTLSRLSREIRSGA